MTKHKRSYKAFEIIKDAFIVLLIASALFLGWESRLFGNASVLTSSFTELLRGMSGGAAESSPAAEQSAAEPDKPVAIAVTNSAGQRVGVRYKMDELKQVYTKTIQYVSEALGSAKTVRETDENAWRSALKSAGVYYEYISPVRLSLLGRWLGCDVSADWRDISVRRLCVIAKNRIFIQATDTGSFYASDTAALNFTEPTDDAGGLGAVFAFESIKDSAAPYTLLLPDTTAYSEIETDNPLTVTKKLDEVFVKLGISPLLNKSYPEPGGGEAYVQGNTKLSLKGDGTIAWTTEEQTPAGSAMDEDGAILLASRMASLTVGRYCGDDAAVYYDTTEALSGGGYKVMFRYIAAGGAVWLHPDGYAAIMTVRNGAVIGMTLRFRNYTVSDSKAVLLPELQAAAATKGDFIVGYDDNGGDLLTPFWANLPLGYR